MNMSSKIIVPLILLIGVGLFGVSMIMDSNRKSVESSDTVAIAPEAKPQQSTVEVNEATSPKIEQALSAAEEVAEISEQIDDGVASNEDLLELPTEEPLESSVNEELKSQFAELKRIEEFPIERTVSAYESEQSFMTAVAENLTQNQPANSEDGDYDAYSVEGQQEESWEQAEKRRKVAQQFTKSQQVQHTASKSSEDDQGFLNSAAEQLAK